MAKKKTDKMTQKEIIKEVSKLAIQNTHMQLMLTQISLLFTATARLSTWDIFIHRKRFESGLARVSNHIITELRDMSLDNKPKSKKFDGLQGVP